MPSYVPNVLFQNNWKKEIKEIKDVITKDSVLFLWAEVQPTLDPCAEAFYKQAHSTSLGRGGVWLMMCASVCVTEG